MLLNKDYHKHKLANYTSKLDLKIFVRKKPEFLDLQSNVPKVLVIFNLH